MFFCHGESQLPPDWVSLPNRIVPWAAISPLASTIGTRLEWSLANGKIPVPRELIDVVVFGAVIDESATPDRVQELDALGDPLGAG
jgi:hypothetical protein